MKIYPFALRGASLAALLLTLSAPAFAQVAPVPNIMNFQGRLAKPDGTPVAHGTYSVLFSLYDALTGGNLKWSETKSVVARNGSFAAALDSFPVGAFNGALYLEIKIGANAALTPRQPLASVAYAMKAGSVADGSVTGASIASGTLTAANFPATFFAENTQSSGSEFRSINVLGGSEINSIAPGVVGGVIAGGGADYFTRPDSPNSVTGSFGTIGGGSGNLAYSDSTVAGGYSNTASGLVSIVAGGYFNTASGDYSFAAGTRAKAVRQGAFVWADSQNSDFSSIDANTFNVRAQNGSNFYSNDPSSFGNIYLSTGDNQFGFLQSNGSVKVATYVGGNAGELGTVSNHPLAFFANNSVPRMTLFPNATLSLGFGLVGVSYPLTVNGTIYCTGFINASDARFKKNIHALESPLDTVVKLRGVTHEWNKAKWPERKFEDGPQFGFIAQETETVFPELVSTDRDGYKSVNYLGVIPVAVEAIKTLKVQMDNKQKQLDAQKQEIDALKTRLALLEADLAKMQAAPKY